MTDKQNMELIAVDLLCRMAESIQKLVGPDGTYDDEYDASQLLQEFHEEGPQPYGWEGYRDLLRGVQDEREGRVHGIDVLERSDDRAADKRIAIACGWKPYEAYRDGGLYDLWETTRGNICRLPRLVDSPIELNWAWNRIVNYRRPTLEHLPMPEDPQMVVAAILRVLDAREGKLTQEEAGQIEQTMDTLTGLVDDAVARAEAHQYDTIVQVEDDGIPYRDEEQE